MRRFKTGQELADLVKQQIGYQLIFVRTVKPIKGIVYMEIPDKTIVWSLLYRLGIKTEKHLNDGYYVYLV